MSGGKVRYISDAPTGSSLLAAILFPEISADPQLLLQPALQCIG